MVVASPRLAERHLVTAPVKTRFAGPIKDGCEQPFTNLRQNRADVQFPLHARRKILYIFRAVRVLQIIKCPSIRKGGRKRCELQRSYLNPFAKARHPRDSAIGRWSSWKRAWMFIRQVVPGKFPEAEKAPVLGNRLESHARPELLKKHVVRVRHCFRQVHVLA